MRRAIIHIGMPRTGTTTLQRVLTSLRGPMLAAGVLYPELTPASADAPHLSHQHLGEALDGRRPAAECGELLDRLAAGLRRADVDTVLISYESLVLARPRFAVPRRLGAFLEQAGYALDCLITVKPQSEYINSMYTWRTQFLKEGRRFDRYARAAMSSPRLRYDALLAPWQAVAGPRLIGVPVHDPSDPAPLVLRILDRLGLAGRIGPLVDAAARDLVENRSPGPLAVEVSRRFADTRLPPGQARELTRLIERLAREAGDPAGFQGVDGARQAAIMMQFADANRRFAEAVWGRPWRDCVAAAPAAAPNEIQPLSADEARIRTICEAVATRPAGAVRRRVYDLFRDLARVA